MVGDLAREWSEWARRCDDDENYGYDAVDKFFTL